jgi:hypothetical protein
MLYPKIETLYVRDKDTFTVTSELRLPEFGLVKHWHVTEKVDGTNVIVTYRPSAFDDHSVRFTGRNGSSELPGPLKAFMEKNVTLDALDRLFDADGREVTLFGEGYGPGIQKGGGNYRSDVSFRLFDVNVGNEFCPGLWLNWDSVSDIAQKLGVDTVPVLSTVASLGEVTQLVHTFSRTAVEDGGKGLTHEGVVARTDPYLLTRYGTRLMFKLKGSDYRAGKR